MEAIWFCLVAVMIAMYVVLDGFDIGAGIVSLFVAKSKEEKNQVIQTIAPVWDGNEVWLLAAGGVLYFAFPKLYASAFQGFYLPLMIVLWLLMFRGLSIELRNYMDNPTWTPFWDFAFGAASLLLAIFFGAALGNVVRGVSLNARGDFFLPLWTDFTVGMDVGILDWFTILVGLLAASTLMMHGALWVALKTEGEISERARKASRAVFFVVAVLTAGVTIAAFAVQPALSQAFADRPWGYIFPLLAVAGLVGVLMFGRYPEGEIKAFLSSAAYIIGMLTSAVQGLFPYVLPATTGEEYGLTAYSAAAPAYGLMIGFAWWIPGMLIATAYFVFTYKRLSGKIKLGEMLH
jgi:cytochrome bd ubiquinol oxidase subunit II